LEIAEKTKKKVAVVTDNDGDYSVKIVKKYESYSAIDCIKLFAS